MATQAGNSAGGGPNDLDLLPLEQALQQLYRTRALIGTIPPGPPTTRGRFGAVLIRIVRRPLSWLFPQLDAFHGALIECAERQMALIEEMRLHIAALDAELARVSLQWTTEADSPAADGSAAGGSAEMWMQIVRCQADIETVRQAIERSPT